MNLTGQGAASRDMSLKKRRLRTCLQILEINLENLDAGKLLRAIARGTAPRSLLAFLPLMHGGADSVIMQRWRKAAGAEPDVQRRADYAALALVLAEVVADCLASTARTSCLTGTSMAAPSPSPARPPTRQL